MRVLIKALNHCHQNGVSHRDMKPQNIMFKDKGDHSWEHLRLIDFGLSCKKVQQMHTIAGSEQYTAPEIYDRKYGKECDVWSLGIILYIMLSGGYFPFEGDSPVMFYSQISIIMFLIIRINNIKQTL